MEFERVMHNAYVNTFAHELGHALGFQHLLNSTAVLALCGIARVFSPLELR
jgi:hypothetical protein